MKKRNIISGIKQYRSEVDTNFHMPGHKGKAEILGELEKNLNFFDITETARPCLWWKTWKSCK